MPSFGVFIQEQAKTLSKIYDLSVFVPRIQALSELYIGKPRLHTYMEHSDGFSVFNEEILLPPKFPKLLFYFRLLLFSQFIHQRYKKILSIWGKPDIIHAHVAWPGGWAAVQIGKKYKTPVVLTEHSGYLSMQFNPNSQRHLVLKTLINSDYIIAVSPAMAEQIKSFCPLIDIDIVGNVIRTDLFKPANILSDTYSAQKTRFLSIASLQKAKGIQYLIKAIRDLVQSGITSFEVIIGGDGPLRNELESLVKDFNISNHCRFLGFLNHNEVSHWMQRCDVFVLPSLRETFGVVLGEAMACGKPVIATRCGGPEFVVTQETGLLVDPANPKALANAMYKFITKQIDFDTDLICHSVLSRFGENPFLNKITRIYEHLWSKSV